MDDKPQREHHFPLVSHCFEQFLYRKLCTAAHWPTRKMIHWTIWLIRLEANHQNWDLLYLKLCSPAALIAAFELFAYFWWHFQLAFELVSFFDHNIVIDHLHIESLHRNETQDFEENYFGKATNKENMIWVNKICINQEYVTYNNFLKLNSITIRFQWNDSCRSGFHWQSGSWRLHINCCCWLW